MILNIFIMISLKKFEKLDLEKFKSEEFENSFLIFGGKTSDTTAPDGGCTCDTVGGTKNYPDGTSYCYSKDRNAYDSGGKNITTTDYDSCSSSISGPIG
jgi:hypothetical protein